MNERLQNVTNSGDLGVKFGNNFRNELSVGISDLMKTIFTQAFVGLHREHNAFVLDISSTVYHIPYPCSDNYTTDGSSWCAAHTWSRPGHRARKPEAGRRGRKGEEREWPRKPRCVM